MANYFNDSPIEMAEDDCYGFLPFAQSLAKSIQSIKAPVGTTISLNGVWGSGKSSVVNLIRAELEEAKDDDLVISDFKCWWYRGEEALALAFLQNLHSLLSEALKEKVKDLVPKIGRGLLQAGPVIGSAIGLTTAGPFAALTGASLTFAQRFFPKEDTLEFTFQKLAKVLDQENRRFLIIIDDMDRLSPNEALAIFRIIKSVGRLPNVMYLLVFDRVLIDKAVREFHPSEGPHFLEKIIQAGFEIPAPLRTDLNHAILSSIEAVCGSKNESDIQRILNIFHDVVAPYLTTPRHVARFHNAITITWPAISNEISLADFIALETLRLYEPSLFQCIRSNKSKLCGRGDSNDQENRRGDQRFAHFLYGIDEAKHHTAKLALQRLFPRIEEIGYSAESETRWDAERRVCIESHFDTYFRLSLSNETLTMGLIKELVERADDSSFIQSTFREATSVIRSNGTTMVPVYLDELNTHAPKIEKSKVEPLLRALFEIHDDIDLDIDKDRGLMAVGETSLRYHWLIRRLTDSRFTIDERTDLYMSTIKHASVGWLVDFVSSARDDYREQENGSKREEDCLVREDVIEELVNYTVENIRRVASDGSLLHHKDLIDILYRWRDFLQNNPAEIRAWTDPLLNNGDALVIFAKKMTGESWSQSLGMIGLGDRVAKANIRAQIDDNVDFLDVAAFKTGLERLQSSIEDEDSRKIVDDFLSAWQRQNADHNE